jgi:hypothetical protein
MRDIADKFVGGIERIDARLAASRPAVSLRAVLLGFAGMAIIAVGEPYNQNIFENTMLIGNHLPVSVLFLMLVLVLIVNPVLTLLPRSTSLFDPARLVVVWACLLPASLWMWQGPADPTARTTIPDGLAGAVVTFIYLLTGVIMALAATYARHRSRRPEPAPSHKAQPTQMAILGALCLAPIVLAPSLTLWLDEFRPEGLAHPLSLILRYAEAIAFLLAASAVVVRLLRRVEPFSPGELVVIMTIMFSACAVIWSGFHRLWAHQLVARSTTCNRTLAGTSW